jgi:hypothetical protein
MSRRKSRRYVILEPGVMLGFFEDTPARPEPSEGSLFSELLPDTGSPGQPKALPPGCVAEPLLPLRRE